MKIKRLIVDMSSALILLLILAAFAWLQNVIDMPIAIWLMKITSNHGAVTQQGESQATQFIGVLFLISTVFAGYIGGRFVRDRPGKVQVFYLIVCVFLLIILRLTSKESGVFVPKVLIESGWWHFLFFIVCLAGAWTRGAVGASEAGSKAEGAASAGAAAASIVEHRHILTDHHDLFH